MSDVAMPEATMVRHDMLGMQLDYLEPSTYLSAIIDRARDGAAGYCCVTNVHMCVLVHDDPKFRQQVNAAAFVIPDSTILQRARSVRYGVPVQETMRGAELMMALCERAVQAGIKIALIGGKDVSALETLQQKLLQAFPSLDIAFAFSPPFRPASEQEDADLVAGLRASGAQLVFVGLGCPKQERWMAEHTGRLDAMMIGVGAAFDFNAGLVETSPVWVHKSGLEWAYRLSKEPRRLWRRYFETSPRFLWLLLLDRAGVRG